MGKGGNASDTEKDDKQNMAAWVCGKNTLRVLPFDLPSQLGPFSYSPLRYKICP